MPSKENEERSSMSKCTKSISLVLIGSALFLSGCHRQPNCPPQDPNCKDPTRSSSSSSSGSRIIPYGGFGRSGGSSPGVSSSPSPGGGFGSTGGHASAGA